MRARWGAVLLGLSLVFGSARADEPSPWALYEHAREEANCGHHEEALELVNEAIAHAPDVGAFHLLRGRLLGAANRDVRAVESLERARRHGDAVTRQNADWALQELGVDHRSVPLYAEDEPR
jgi:predicted Zn-dependent protease